MCDGSFVPGPSCGGSQYWGHPCDDGPPVPRKLAHVQNSFPLKASVTLRGRSALLARSRKETAGRGRSEFCHTFSQWHTEGGTTIVTECPRKQGSPRECPTRCLQSPSGTVRSVQKVSRVCLQCVQDTSLTLRRPQRVPRHLLGHPLVGHSLGHPNFQDTLGDSPRFQAALSRNATGKLGLRWLEAF